MPGDDFGRRLKHLEDELSALKERKTPMGGMLSGDDILRGVIREADRAKDYLSRFEARDWTYINRKYKRKFLIQEFDMLNVTPFSYDLLLGDQFFSVQKLELYSVEDGQSYSLEPHETVVVITKELVAIPSCYSATIWPRFTMVREGIFQSMVKIDPTWYGKLAVAISNFSPATIPLPPGRPFATLLLYNLASESKFDLWQPTWENRLKMAGQPVPLPAKLHSQAARIQDFIRDHGLDKWLKCEGTDVTIYGLRSEELSTLNQFSQEPEWQGFCKTLASNWAERKHPDTNRHVVWTGALGLTDLRDIVKGVSKDGRYSPADIRDRTCTEDEILSMALNYGKPFDVVAKIPKTVESHLREEIAGRVEATIMPRMVTLMLSVLGFLSLITALAAFSVRSLVGDQQISEGTMRFMWATAMMVASITIVCFFLINWRSVGQRLGRRKANKKK